MPASALATDLYQLTMMAGYLAAGLTDRATFELFVRRLPSNRGYIIAAGLEQAVEYLENLRFASSDIEYLREVPELRGAPESFFSEYLPAFRFRGDVHALAEGTPLFPGEPILRVTASLPEAQVVETALLATIGFQSSVATKAARVVSVAGDRSVIEFGARRAHGIESGTLAARAAYLGGCDATSDVEAGARWGIPVSGTMAHAWVLAHDDETQAMREFADLYGQHSVLLVDTYDTLAAVHRIIASGLRPAALRLDSGDLVALSREARRLLDAAGLTETRLFASGDLDEYRIEELLKAGAQIDGFGVGAAISVITDAPSLGAVYKLVQIRRNGAWRPVMKRSEGKRTYPGAKQVWRVVRDGMAQEDALTLEDEEGPEAAQPLLAPVMREGRAIVAPQDLATLRNTSREMLDALPADLKRIRGAAAYRVRCSAGVERLTRQALGRGHG